VKERSRIRLKATPAQIGRVLRAGLPFTDSIFDDHLPDQLRRVSHQFSTPINVVLRICEWLTETGTHNVLDIGSGAGKFCVAAALATDCEFVGLEQRPWLVTAARRLAKRFQVHRRVEFVEGVLREEGHDGFDGYYLFNPFGENILGREAWLDDSVELSERRWDRDVSLAEGLIERLPLGTRVITYNGFGGRIPDCYSEIRVDRTTPSLLRMWERMRAKGSGRYRLDATRD
jgi:SAM-dependent methyltransferase